MSRAALSVCIITLDEERNLPDCLASVAWADEVVILDSASTDRTRAIAEAAGARVHVRPFAGHVAQKNAAAALATHRWILGLDADERVTPALRRSIEAALGADDPAIAAYAVSRRTRYLGRWIRHSGWYPEWRVRLWRAGAGRWGGDDPHDRLEVAGRVERLPGDLEHEGFRSLAAHLAKIDAHSTAAARSLHAKGARPGAAKLFLRPAARFARMYVVERGFLDGLRGLVLASMGAMYVFSKYLKLWERWRAASRR